MGEDERKSEDEAAEQYILDSLPFRILLSVWQEQTEQNQVVVNELVIVHVGAVHDHLDRPLSRCDYFLFLILH